MLGIEVRGKRALVEGMMANTWTASGENRFTFAYCCRQWKGQMAQVVPVVTRIMEAYYRVRKTEGTWKKGYNQRLHYYECFVSKPIGLHRCCQYRRRDVDLHSSHLGRPWHLSTLRFCLLFSRSFTGHYGLNHWATLFTQAMVKPVEEATRPVSPPPLKKRKFESTTTSRLAIT